MFVNSFYVCRFFMKRSIIAYSSNPDAKLALEEVKKKISSQKQNPILIVFFSDITNFEYYTMALKKDFTETTIIGSSTYKSFCSEGFGHNGISCLAVYKQIECASGVIFEIKNDPKKYEKNLSLALNKFNDYSDMVCLEFSNGFTNGEEQVLDVYNSLLADKKIPVAGATSSTSLDLFKKNKNDKYAEKSSSSLVSLDGNIYANSSVFVLIKNLNGKIITFNQTFYKPIESIIIPTDIDYKNRIVYEYDGKIAADYLSEKLHLSLENFEENFMNYPVARNYSGKFYLSQIEKINKDGSLKYFSQIFNQTKIHLTQKDDFQKVLASDAKEISYQLLDNSFAISLSSFYMIRNFEREDKFLPYMDFYSNVSENYIGISGFGQQLFNFNQNQTSIIVIFE